MIKGIFCHDLPIYKDIKGFYGCTTLTDTVFGRYLELVDELVVATRLYHLDCTLEEANQEKITLPGLKFLDIPNLNKPQYYLTRLPKARKLIEDEFKTCDLVFIRGGTIADIGAGLARKYNKPYMCECGGCAWDNWWNYSFLGKMIAPWSELIVKRTIKNAAFVTYVTENWLQVRYPTNGQAQGISDVVIEDVSNDILVRRLDKIQHRKSDEPWVIGTAAGLETKCKGQQFVIEAIADLKNTMNIRYELAGTGDPSNIRAMTTRERARIQTFPDTFVFPENTANTEQMIGNAVPVQLATFVASSLSDFVDGKQYSCNMQFIDWLKSNKGFTNRAAGDIVSRIIRANKIVPIKQYTGFDYVNKLDSTKSFKSIKPVVQSQVKRAVRLYFEYLDISTKEPEVTLHDSGT